MNSASPPRRTGWTEFVLFSILGIATLVAYAREHELPVLVYPGAATLGRALAYGGGAAVGAVVMALVVGLIGRGLWRDPQQPGWAMAATCGWIWIGMVGTLLLLVGGLHRVTAWLILIPALRAAAAIVSRRRVGGLTSAGVDEPARTGAADRLWTGFARLLLVTILLIMGACSLAPTIAFDDHVYHLPIVRAFVERGSLWLDSGQPNVYRPALHAVWMAVAELVGGPAVSRLVNIAVWLTLVLLACGTARALVRLGIVAIMALTAQVLVLVDSAYADMGLALLFVAVLEFGVPRDADPAAEAERWRWFGLACGALPATKYQGLILLPIALLGAQAWCGTVVANGAGKSGDGVFRLVRARAWLGWFVLALLLVSGPFYLRNILLVGNPLFPHLGQHAPVPTRVDMARLAQKLPGTDMVSEGLAFFLERFGMGKDPLDLVLVPWRVSVYGHFHDHRWSLQFFDGDIGVLPLLAWIVILRISLSSQRARIAVILGTTLMFLWWLGSQQMRHIVPLLALAAWAWSRLVPPGKHAALLVLVAALAVPWSGGYAVHRFLRTAPVVAGQVTAAAWTAERLPPAACYQWMSGNLATDAAVLVVLEERTHLLPRRHIWTGLLPVWFANFVWRLGGGPAVDEFLRREGVTHVLMPRYGLQVFPEVSDDRTYRATLRALFAERWRVVYADPWVVLFAVGGS